MSGKDKKEEKGSTKEPQGDPSRGRGYRAHLARSERGNRRDEYMKRVKECIEVLTREKALRPRMGDAIFEPKGKVLFILGGRSRKDNKTPKLP